MKIADGFPGQRLVVIPRDLLEKTRGQPLIRDLQITHIGHFSRASGHFVERRKGTPQYVLIYCLSGEGECCLDGKTHPVATGDVVLLPPNQMHSYGARGGDPWTIFWVHFRGGRASDHAAALGVSPAEPVLHSPQPERLQQAFEDIYRHALDGFSETGMLGLTTSLPRLVGLLKMYARPRGSVRSRLAEDRILTAIRTLQAQPMRDWSLTELAAEAGMSAPHFSELFTRQAGVPPKQFLIRQRLQIACALLQDPGLKLAEIAARTGYEDPYYFSRLFRRHTGQSPAAYRREIASRAQ